MIDRTVRWFAGGLVAGLLMLVLPSMTGAQTLDSVLVVPNPYNVSGRTFGDRSGNLTGYERIRFANVPLPCTIRIYSSSGSLVKTLRVAAGTKLVEWNGRNDDNQYIDSDVYYYIVEHADLGRKLGKFVVIR